MVGVGMEGVEVERLKVGRNWGEGGMIGERGGAGEDGNGRDGGLGS